MEIDELEYLMQKHGLAIRAIPLLIENGRKTPCFSYGDIRPGFTSCI
jgi:hypothetical protein